MFFLSLCMRHAIPWDLNTFPPCDSFSPSSEIIFRPGAKRPFPTKYFLVLCFSEKQKIPGRSSKNYNSESVKRFEFGSKFTNNFWKDSKTIEITLRNISVRIE